jgi:hypothetical protein
MAKAGSRVAAQLIGILVEERTGLNAALAQLNAEEGLHLPAIAPEHLRAQNVSADLADKSIFAKYPAVHVYCEKLSNTLREKFRTFSGKARMVIEARVSQDRLEGIEQHSQRMADAITNVLDASRGEWGGGMFYAGGYEVAYGPVKHGGRHLLQITKVIFEVDISAN